MTRRTSSAAIRSNAEKYFNSCRALPDSSPYDWVYPPTVSGLAIALGFDSKEQLFEYCGTPLVMCEISRAITMLEDAVESSLYKKDRYQAAKFVLTNHFKGWSDKAEKGDETSVTIIDDIGR